MEAPRKDSDSFSSGQCTSCAATRGSSVTEWHAEDCVDAPKTLIPASPSSREGYSSATALNQTDHATGQISYSSILYQVDTSGCGPTADPLSPNLLADSQPQQYNVQPRVDSPAPISQLQSRSSQQMARDALGYEDNPRPCGRRPPSVQLVSFCRDLERENPRSVVARAAEAFADVPDNVSEADHDDLRAWGQHYRWDRPRASGAGHVTAGDLWWDAVSPLSQPPSPGYGHGRNVQ
ncbi:hypothetical protein MCOR25_007424 [Pyricularia grisea]|uniref:Uncharacterized protein n=1 Tax=Pyricularia grisea TaxID=148305 RepID=A0A6P8B8K7_PYRGI|nr:uncharacterized protein PgNI_03644 [Pyricularia grisea]KAI6358189.1 hypothetical protein MCOR25_007424 [Pyricularia grisea]TLD12189.1 hypothetical protein PgNI_03644 [Pyricularia grisea]